MTSDIELKPCKQCGATPVLKRERRNDRDRASYLYCYECPGCGARARWEATTQRQAVKEWAYMQQGGEGAMTEGAQTAAGEPKYTTSEAPADSAAKARAAKRAGKEKGAAAPEATSLASKPLAGTEGTGDSATGGPKDTRRLTGRARRNERARSSREGAAAVADPEAVSAIHEALGRLYSVQDVSAALRVTARTTLSYLKSGALRGRKVGGTWLISEANLKRFVEGE